MVYVVPPPPIEDLPVTEGKDIIVDFQRTDPASHAPLDYDDGSIVSLIIETTPPIIATATPEGSHAICRIPADQTPPETVKQGTLWRCEVAVVDGADTIGLVPMNGRVVRFDGKPPKSLPS